MEALKDTNRLTILRVKRKRDQEPVDFFAVLPGSSTKKPKNLDTPNYFRRIQTQDEHFYPPDKENIQIALSNHISLNKADASIEKDNKNQESILESKTFPSPSKPLDIYDVISEQSPENQMATYKIKSFNQPPLQNSFSLLNNHINANQLNLSEQFAKSLKVEKDTEYVYDMYYSSNLTPDTQTDQDVFSKNNVATLFWDERFGDTTIESDASDYYNSDDSNAENYYANEYPDSESDSDNEDNSDYSDEYIDLF
ncbi:hypothetical protein BB558_000466 [Smittium angustum]|uniref:Probable RNA polymerase II nuclear localization protein SLC7A6OS n=1 Tax=Smittium angustum TaxID=133377 RepID=A0A2U1JE30_SMIAN|nr:hypothetical protein BB558_000466 [Smittium angustum]